MASVTAMRGRTVLDEGILCDVDYTDGQTQQVMFTNDGRVLHYDEWVRIKRGAHSRPAGETDPVRRLAARIKELRLHVDLELATLRVHTRRQIVAAVTVGVGVGVLIDRIV